MYDTDTPFKSGLSAQSPSGELSEDEQQVGLPSEETPQGQDASSGSSGNKDEGEEGAVEAATKFYCYLCSITCHNQLVGRAWVFAATRCYFSLLFLNYCLRVSVCRTSGVTWTAFPTSKGWWRSNTWATPVWSRCCHEFRSLYRGRTKTGQFFNTLWQGWYRCFLF